LKNKFTIVPVRLEDCGHGDHRLSIFQQYDLFKDFEKELDRLAVHIGSPSLSDAKAKDERTEDEKLIDSLFGKAAIAFYSGDYETAISITETVIKLYPDNHEAWNNKGDILLKSGKYKEALKAAKKAIEFNPNFYEAIMDYQYLRLI